MEVVFEPTYAPQRILIMNEGEKIHTTTEEPLDEAHGFSRYAQGFKCLELIIKFWHESYGNLPYKDRRAIIVRALKAYHIQ